MNYIIGRILVWLDLNVEKNIKNTSLPFSMVVSNRINNTSNVIRFMLV